MKHSTAPQNRGHFLSVALCVAVASHAVFLVAGLRYSPAIHLGFRLGGFFLGIAACLVLSYLCTLILP
jgi:hypothetical protein